MSLSRQCSRTACGRSAVATLTYVYSDSTAVLGPLATFAEPHTYDLCHDHAERLTAPRGWDVVRLAGDYLEAEPEPAPDDLLAMVDAVRETRPAPRPTGSARPAGRSLDHTLEEALARESDSGALEVGRRGHLRVLRDPHV